MKLHKNQTGSAVIILLVILVLAIVGFGGYDVWSQHNKKATVATSTTPSSTTTTSQKYLVINEWSVQFPYPGNVKNLSYALSTDPQTPSPEIVSINLDGITGTCKGTNQLLRAQDGKDLDGYGHTPTQYIAQYGASNVKKVGTYYYLFSHGPGSCAQDNKTVTQINSLSAGLKGAEIQKLVSVN